MIKGIKVAGVHGGKEETNKKTHTRTSTLRVFTCTHSFPLLRSRHGAACFPAYLIWQRESRWDRSLGSTITTTCHGQFRGRSRMRVADRESQRRLRDRSPSSVRANPFRESSVTPPSASGDRDQPWRMLRSNWHLPLAWPLEQSLTTDIRRDTPPLYSSSDDDDDDDNERPGVPRPLHRE